MCIIVDLAAYLDNDNMHLHLEKHMCKDLAGSYLHANCKNDFIDIVNLNKWIDKVCILDNNLCREASYGKKLFRTLMAENSSTFTPIAFSTTKPSHFPHAQTNNPSSSISQRTSMSSGLPKVMKVLTEANAIVTKATYEICKKSIITRLTLYTVSAALFKDKEMVGDFFNYIKQPRIYVSVY